MATEAGPPASLARLLRCVQDSELFHVERAIQAAKHRQATSSEAPDAEQQHSSQTQERILTLADHKRIANVQLVLSAIDRALRSNDEFSDDQAARHLISALGNALMTQIARDCSATRENFCVWGLEATKRLVLLHWIATQQASASPETNHVLDLITEGLRDAADKKRQFLASLVLFDLLQRQRQRVNYSEGQLTLHQETALISETAAVNLLDALQELVHQGFVLDKKDSGRMKPSKLGQNVMETMVALCSDQAAKFLISVNHYASISIVKPLVQSMDTALDFLRRWHGNSSRRRLLVLAIDQLRAYVCVCNTLLSYGQAKENASNDLIAALRMLCWQWNTSAMLLCSRSAASLKATKNQGVDLLSHTISLLGRGPNTDVHRVAAQVRRLCILISFAAGQKNSLHRAFESFESKGYFLLFLLRGLEISLTNNDEDCNLTLMITSVLRSLLLDKVHDGKSFALLESTADCQAFLLPLVRILHIGGCVKSKISARSLEIFVADFVLQRNLTTVTVTTQLQDLGPRNLLSMLSLLRTILVRLHVQPDPLLRLIWRRTLMPVVWEYIIHPDHLICAMAQSCLCYLDPVQCVRALTQEHSDLDDTMTKEVISTLFSTTDLIRLEDMVVAFVDCWRQESQIGRSKQDATTQPEQAQTLNEHQERLLRLVIDGWCKTVTSHNSRRCVLRVLLRKIIGSPRDTSLFRFLRELANINWLTGATFIPLLDMLVGHMTTQSRLTDELLDDTSLSSTRAVEEMLFSRLAPMLILRLFPRAVFSENCDVSLQYPSENHFEPSASMQEGRANDEDQSKSNTLFHLLLSSVTDPLEFKEVKLVVVEILAKFPPRRVLPFIFGYIVAFLQEESVTHLSSTSRTRTLALGVDSEISVPSSCGLVTGKLMIYYLNRMFAEDLEAYKDAEILSRTISLLIRILSIPPSVGDQSRLADLQMGCIDCVALVLTRTISDGSNSSEQIPLLQLLLNWIGDSSLVPNYQQDDDLRVLQHEIALLLDQANAVENGGGFHLLLQVRICCCNVLLSTLTRLDPVTLWAVKRYGLIQSLFDIISTTSTVEIVAACFQILFSFIYRLSDATSVGIDTSLKADLTSCFGVTLDTLYTMSGNEQVCMNALKLIGALIGKFPDFFHTLSPGHHQELKRCLTLLMEHQPAPSVQEFTRSLLHAIN